MANIPGVLITVAGLSFFFYMTGYKGLIVLGVLAMMLMGAIYFKQGALLYMPVVPGLPKSTANNPFGLRHPNQHDLEAIDLSLNTSDGVIVRGWHVKAAKSERIIIYFHENAGNIGARLYYVREICKRTNSDVILVAYRGYSDSQSVPTETGLMLDSYAIMEYAMSNAHDHQNVPIYLLGRSLGGAVAVNLAVQQYFQNHIKGVILENTFTSISDMVDVLLPVLSYFKFLQRNYWPSIDRIAKIKSPILFIKCLQDELVPPQHMHKLMNAATAPKKQYQIKRGTHNSSWDTEPNIYFSKFIQFFDELQKLGYLT